MSSPLRAQRSIDYRSESVECLFTEMDVHGGDGHPFPPISSTCHIVRSSVCYYQNTMISSPSITKKSGKNSGGFVLPFTLVLPFVFAAIHSFEGPSWGMSSTGVQRGGCLRALASAIEDDKEVGLAVGGWYHAHRDRDMVVGSGLGMRLC